MNPNADHISVCVLCMCVCEILFAVFYVRTHTHQNLKTWTRDAREQTQSCINCCCMIIVRQFFSVVWVMSEDILLWTFHFFFFFSFIWLLANSMGICNSIRLLKLVSVMCLILSRMAWMRMRWKNADKRVNFCPFWNVIEWMIRFNWYEVKKGIYKWNSRIGIQWSNVNENFFPHVISNLLGVSINFIV